MRRNIRTTPIPLDALPPEVITNYAETVTQRVRDLDAHAARLGRAFGIPMTDFDLSETPARPTDVAMVVLFGIAASFAPVHRVTLQKHEGRWGLFYSKEPSVAALAASSTHVPARVTPLDNAPLDVREKFLARSEAFFEKYVERCQGRLQAMQQAVQASDRTFAMLERLNLPTEEKP